MKFSRTIRLLLSFYRSFFFLNTLITLVFFYIRSYKHKEFYYYQNLGLSRGLLWTTTFCFDFALFLFLLYETYPGSR